MCQPGRPSPHGESHAGSPALACFHSTKSSGSCLADIDLDALAGAQVVERLARQLAVAGKFAHRVVHVAVGRLVGEAVVLPAWRSWSSICGTYSVARGSWSGRSTPSASASSCIAAMKRSVSCWIVSPFSAGALDDLVVDVGDVAHIGHVVAARPQPAADHVEHHHHARMAEVAVVVHGHAAHVHAHLAGFDGRENLFVPVQGVVDPEHGWGISRRCPARSKLWKDRRS